MQPTQQPGASVPWSHVPTCTAVAGEVAEALASSLCRTAGQRAWGTGLRGIPWSCPAQAGPASDVTAVNVSAREQLLQLRLMCKSSSVRTSDAPSSRQHFLMLSSS